MPAQLDQPTIDHENTIGDERESKGNRREGNVRKCAQLFPIISLYHQTHTKGFFPNSPLSLWDTEKHYSAHVLGLEATFYSTIILVFFLIFQKTLQNLKAITVSMLNQ